MMVFNTAGEYIGDLALDRRYEAGDVAFIHTMSADFDTFQSMPMSSTVNMSETRHALPIRSLERGCSISRLSLRNGGTNDLVREACRDPRFKMLAQAPDAKIVVYEDPCNNAMVVKVRVVAIEADTDTAMFLFDQDQFTPV